MELLFDEARCDKFQYWGMHIQRQVYAREDHGLDSESEVSEYHQTLSEDG